MTKSSRAQKLLPPAILAVAIIGAFTLIRLKPAVAKRAPDVRPPLVRVMTVELQDVTMRIPSQGTVQPATESQLVAEVSGRIVTISDAFSDGEFFEKGELLLSLDAFDYEQALVTARAELARAELRLAQEEAESILANEEWQDLGRGDPDPLTMRTPQLTEARAALEAARSRVQQSQRNLERTEIRAPYKGRFRKTMVDLGQFVGVGTPIAQIYGTDAVEVVLPLTDRDLAFVDVPLGPNSSKGSKVELTVDFAGRQEIWEGELVRTTGIVDPQTRMLPLVAKVQSPYPLDRPPLSPGIYVKAQILGRQEIQLAPIPREAIRPDNQVMVIDDENRLHFRQVEVLRMTTSDALIKGGLSNGERIVISRLEVVTDGMRVEAIEQED